MHLMMRQPDKPLDELQPVAATALLNNHRFWRPSIMYLGNCSYWGVVFPEQFTRYVVVDPVEHASVLLDFFDPTLTPLNFKHRGDYYRKAVAWLFGDAIEHPALDEQMIHLERFGEVDHSEREQAEKGRDHWKEQSANRIGIEVVTLPRENEEMSEPV